MIIRTTSEVKTLLQIAESTYDSVISALIPVVSEWIIDYTNNKFIDRNIYCYSNNISFDADSGTITDNDGHFLDNDLGNVDYICVDGSKHNDGIYRVASVTADTITLHNDEVALKDESAGAMVYIWNVVIPRAIHKIFADMIRVNLDTRERDVAAESLGDHSITYSNVEPLESYSASVLNRLKPYKKLKWQ